MTLAGPGVNRYRIVPVIDNELRFLKDRLLLPIVRRLPESFTPTRVTLAALAPGVLAAGAATLGWTGAAVVLFLVNRVLDGLDGLIARDRGLASDLGGYIDLMCDFLVYALIPAGVAAGALARHGAPLWPLALLLGVFYLNAASWLVLSAILEKRTLAERTSGKLATSIVMPRGLVEGTETILAYTVMLLLPHRFGLVAVIMAIATSAGIVQRIVWALRHLAETR